MDNIFRKLCHYYILNEDPDILEEIMEANPENLEEQQQKVEEFLEKLKRQTTRLGYGIDFESFCNLLEEYINTKDTMEENDKVNYLKILMTLSEIHEINLRAELERYISYKKEDEIEEISEQEIFYRFCRYNLNSNNDVEEFNELKELASNNNIDFKDLQKEAIMYVEEIKVLAESLGYEIEETNFENIINDYLNKKKRLNDYDKARYLKVLLYLSEIYGINLRNLLTTNQEEQKEEKVFNDLSLSSIFNNLTNPLDNKLLMSELLDQRYYSGYFDVREIVLSDDDVIKNEEYNYQEIQAELVYKIYRIFLDKFNNYAFDDLNDKYLNLITEEDLSRLETLTEEDILKIIELLNNHESSHYIIKKYKLTNNLYNFIEQSITETLDLKREHIGIGENSLFINDNEPYTIRIYLNGPEHETYLLLKDYIKKCVENNLNYDIKATGDNKDDQEGSILFASINDIVDKLRILDEIFNNYQSLYHTFKNPIYSSGTLNNSKYGISHSGVINDINRCIKSYNDYFNSICEVAYYRTLSKIILDIVTDNEAKNIINSFIALINISFDKADKKSPEQAEYNGINFETIKDLVNQYIPLVSSTLSIYITDEVKKENLIQEFSKSMLYISNICQNRHKKDNSNIAISSYLEAFIKNN